MELGDVVLLKKGDKYKNFLSEEVSTIEKDTMYLVKQAFNEGHLEGDLQGFRLLAINEKEYKTIRVILDNRSPYGIERGIEVIGVFETCISYKVILNTGEEINMRP